MQTQIVCTLGPASDHEDVIRDMVQAGMSIARLNFSHGLADEHRVRAERVRRTAGDLGHRVQLMQDLQGPKIRTVDTPRTTLVRGQEVVLRRSPGNGALVISEPALLKAIEPGSHIYLDDGLLELVTIGKSNDEVRARVLIGGTISGNQGVVCPQCVLPLPALTERDLQDVQVGLSIGVEWIALSFVQRREDVDQLRAIVGDRARVIAKIETPPALDEMGEIISASDAIMVARGDLGVSIPRARVPIVQKDLILLARQEGTASIVATEMLLSMVEHAHPTRAEVGDVATAVLDGASAVMLSEETAIGAYPVQTVAEMREIVETIEASEYYHWPEEMAGVDGG